MGYTELDYIYDELCDGFINNLCTFSFHDETQIISHPRELKTL